MRPQLHDLLGHVVHARYTLEQLKDTILYEVNMGRRPKYRGHYWGKQHFEVVGQVEQALDAAFHLLKWLQFPEVSYRLSEAQVAMPSLFHTAP